MAATTRFFSRSLAALSKQGKKCCRLTKISTRNMGQHTRAVVPTIKTKDAARTFVLHLDDHARSLIKEQLHDLEKMEVLKYLEEEIDQIEAGIEAAHSGATVISSEHEPIKEKKVVVSKSQLWDVFVFAGVPFIGFGLLDNLTMIVAGEYIDATLGAALGISTMAAAGLGNLVSDVAGVASAGYIEVFSGRIGVRTPELTKEQAQQKQTQYATALGRAVGISLGCLIGMFPLLFFPGRKDNKEEVKVNVHASIIHPEHGTEHVEQQHSLESSYPHNPADKSILHSASQGEQKTSTGDHQNGYWKDTHPHEQHPSLDTSTPSSTSSPSSQTTTHSSKTS